MSFLASVINSADQQSLQTINDRLPAVITAVKSCREKVLRFVENVYITFIERPKRNKVLSQKSTQLQNEVTELKLNLEQIIQKNVQETREEVVKELEILKQLSIGMDFVKTTCEIHEAFVDIRELCESKTYVDCVDKMRTTEDLLNSTRNKDLPLFEAFKEQLLATKTQLLQMLAEEFKKDVLLQQNGCNRFLIKDNNILNEVIPALYHFSESITYLDQVTKFIWDQLLVPIVDSTTIVTISTEDDVQVLQVKILDPNLKCPYHEVFSNLKTVMTFLSTHFNITIDDNFTTLKYIGRDIRDNLSELIIKHCLQETVPANEEELKQYNVVVEATKDLETCLIKADIFDTETTSILKYANNIEVVFIDRKCREYLQQSEPLMKKDLHSLIEVGSQKQDVFEPDSVFPKCSVSKGLIELLYLLENILKEAASKSPMCAARLFIAVQNICQKYVVFVPEFHKKFLQTIPQQIAVFHNNCMYFAHKLIEFNDTYVAQLAIVEVPTPNLVKEVQHLQRVAFEMFDTYVDSQIKQMLETLKSSGLEGKRTLTQLEDSTEKCLRQCLRQQELLKTVWAKVLPYNRYNQTLGRILNSMCVYIVNCIVKFEDISTDAAQNLVDLLKMIQTRGPKLFTDPKEVTLFVESWYKLNEVVFVLNASLVDINDRWAAGKGPLALQFKPEELKQLIKALFQNTQRRATLLEKIHL